MTTPQRTENGDGRRQGAMRAISTYHQRPVRTRTVAIDESGPNPPAADAVNLSNLDKKGMTNGK